MMNENNNDHSNVAEEEAKQTAKPKKKLTKEQKLAAEITKLKAEVAEWKNSYYKVYADMANARKQDEKDRSYFVKYRAVGFVENLLPALDAFNIVLQNEVEDEVLNNYLKGFKYIHGQLVEVLKNEGVSEQIPKVGEKFDGTYMHALDTVYEAEVKPNTIVQVINNCYKLHDRIIRPAMVIVTTNIKPEQEETEEIRPEDMN